MKIYKVTVFAKNGKIVDPYPRVYNKSQGVSAVKGHWESTDRLADHTRFSAPYTVDVKTIEVDDDAWT